MWSESPISQLTLNNFKYKLGKLLNKWISQGRETFHIQSTLGTEITRLSMIVHDTRPYLTDKEMSASEIFNQPNSWLEIQQSNVSSSI